MLFCIRLPNFVQIGAPVATIWRHIHFSRWWPRPLNTTSGFVFVDVTAFRRSKSISKPNFVDTAQFTAEIQLLPVLKNKRPPYWNFTSGFHLDHFIVIGVSFCTRLPNFVKIGTSTAEIWRYIDFQDGGRQPCCICFAVMADHPRSAFHGPNSILKSLVRLINSSGDIAIYRFWRFGLKLPIHARPFWGSFWGIFPHMTSPIVVTPKRTFLWRKHVVWAIQRKNQYDGSTWARAQEKKYRTTKMSQKCYISPIWGEAPTGPIRPKSCMTGDV